MVAKLISMPEGCHWMEKNGVYSVYYSYLILSSAHEYLGEMTDLLGQTRDLGDVIGIAEKGKARKDLELIHKHE